MNRVLLIHPSEWRMSNVEAALRNAGFDVICIKDHGNILMDLYSEVPDLVVIGNTLPENNDLCGRIAAIPSVPVIAICRAEKGANGISMLNEGADAYMDYPIANIELIARAHALLRRFVDRRQGGLRFYPKTNEVEIERKKIKFSATQFRLLACLVLNEGRFVPYEQLKSEVWGKDLSMNTLHFHLRRLRMKLEPEFLEEGYRLAEFRGKGCSLIRDRYEGYSRGLADNNTPNHVLR